jgi:CDP-diacylglycerol pyrophosphatase
MADSDSTRSVSRRRFLSASGAVGAGAVLAGAGSWPAMGDPAGAPGTDDCGYTDSKDLLWVDVKDASPTAPGSNIVVAKPDPHTFGYAVRRGSAQTYDLLVLPTSRIRGIECSDIWAASALNLWPIAWSAAKARLPGPPDIMLGINSRPGRRRDQLHIHLTAFEHGARTEVDGLKGVPTDPSAWNKTMFVVQGHVYRILHVKDLNQNLFTLLKDHVSQKDMFAQSMAVVAGPSGGFYVLNSQGKPVSGETPHTPELRINNSWGTATIEDVGLMYRGK